MPADALFRVYTACPGDVRTLVLDVRGSKEFSKKHLIGSYCIRLSANGRVLLVRGLGGWGVRLGEGGSRAHRQLGTLAGTRVTAGGVGDDGCGTESNRTAPRTCWAKRRCMVYLIDPQSASCCCRTTPRTSMTWHGARTAGGTDTCWCAAGRAGVRCWGAAWRGRCVLLAAQGMTGVRCWCAAGRGGCVGCRRRDREG